MGGRLTPFIVGLLSAVAATSSRAAERSGCKLDQIAELPVTMVGSLPVVTARINGEPARLAVFSASNFSAVTEAAAERLKLKVRPLPAGYSVVSSRANKVVARRGLAQEFVLDKSAFQRVEFVIGGGASDIVDGGLGQNVLGAFDVEYDLQRSVIRLFKPQGCERARLAYWVGQDAYSAVPIAPTTPASPDIVAQAKVNEMPIRAVLNTGEDRSILSLDAARRAGATPQDRDASRAADLAGRGTKQIDTYILPFRSFAIGEETIANTRLRVAKAELEGRDMVLGMDFLLSHRVLVSQSQHMLYFTYNGGPVFRLDDASTRQASAPNAGPAIAEPEDVAALKRRAAVSLARKDFPSAIADLDKAIAADPRNPELYAERAHARLGGDDPASAMADLNRVLELQPENVIALIERGYLHLKADDGGKADVDFAAALAAAPDKPLVGLTIASYYSDGLRFEKAVAAFDVWLAQHPKSQDRSRALNGRCWARALWGQDLDKALDDCNEAIKRGAGPSRYLDSRGLVHLRRGEFDAAIADYDRSLTRQPKQAASLYGRGLARLKRGDRSEGEADIAAAVAIEPKYIELMRAAGITETTVVVASRH